MERFSKKIAVDKEVRLFVFTRIENTNGVKFFITTTDSNQKPVACSLKQREHGTDWKLIPGSLRWLYEIEEDLSNAIIETLIDR
jgi:hypothetical protein